MAINPENIKNIGSILRKRYLLAFIIIASLITLSEIIIQFTISREESFSRIINIAGRQRMLSQRINKASFGLYLAEDPKSKDQYLNELKFSVDLWKHSHIALQNGDKEMGLPGNNSKTISELFATIEKSHQNIIKAANDIISIAQKATYKKEDLLLKINDIKHNEVIFLDGMDAIVFQYDYECIEKIKFTKRASIFILFFTFFVLLMELIFIFRPAEKEITNTFDEIQKTKDILKHYATFDEMTGFFNKRSGMLILENEFNKAKNENLNLSISFIDIDGLKNVNDTYGHAEGDWYIKTISNIILRNIGPKDSVFRYGGDEIVLIFNQCNILKAHSILKKIEKQISFINKEYNKPYKISISYGIVNNKLANINKVDSFIKYADKVMYENKRRKKYVQSAK